MSKKRSRSPSPPMDCTPLKRELTGFPEADCSEKMEE
jgi:hypothetical protein